MTIVWYHGEFTDRIFYWSPAWTKTSEFEQSVEVRTDAKSESGIFEGFPSMNISPGRDPFTVLRLSSSHVLLAVITLFLQTLAFYHVNDVKIHTFEQQLKDLGAHFEKSAFGPSVWIQIHVDIDFTKLGANAFIILFLRLRCGAHLIISLLRTMLLSHSERILLPSVISAYRDAIRIYRLKCFTNLMKKNTKTKKRARILHARKRRSGTNFPKIVIYKSPSHSKLNNLIGWRFYLVVV